MPALRRQPAFGIKCGHAAGTSARYGLAANVIGAVANHEYAGYVGPAAVRLVLDVALLGHVQLALEAEVYAQNEAT